MRRQRGITLIELMISLVIVALVTAASSRAFLAALNADKQLNDGRILITERRIFEDRIRDLLQHAWLSSDANETASYFIAGDPSEGGQSAAAGALALGNGADTLTFTAAGLRPNLAALSSNNDFETSNQLFGPQGGVREVSLQSAPIGAEAPNTQGVFLRLQLPADGDPSQGGFEESIGPKVVSMSYEFFDGLAWQPTWDTRQQTTRRLPAVVRVSYRFEGEELETIFHVRIPASDVTPDNPVEVEGE